MNEWIYKQIQRKLYKLTKIKLLKHGIWSETKTNSVVIFGVSMVVYVK